MAKTREVSSVWVVIIFHLTGLLFHHTTVVSGRCSRCDSAGRTPAFGPPGRWECNEIEANIDNDFTRIPEFDLGDPDNQCDCRQGSRITQGRYCCELEEIFNFQGELVNAICRCIDRCYREPDCPANKCDYSFQCDTTLYVCWNLVSPQDLGLQGLPFLTTTDGTGSITPTTSTNGESSEEDDISCTENASLSSAAEIEEIVYCRDLKDNIYDSPGEEGCGTFCSTIEIQTAIEDDPNDSTIIGTKVCPNGKTVTQYAKFCSPGNEEGGPPDGLRFDQCPPGIRRCILPFCEYENEFTLTPVPSKLPAATATTTITCPDDLTLDVSYTHDGHPLPISVKYDDPVVVSDSISSCPLKIILHQSKGLSSGSMFPIGTTTNTYQVISQSDSSGSIISTCSFDISIVDKQPPLIFCPNDMTVQASSCNTVTVDYGPIKTSDNSPGMLSVVQLNGLSSGAPYPVGSTTRNTFQVIDTWGNTNTCSFDVHVVGDGDHGCVSNHSSKSSSSKKGSKSTKSEKKKKKKKRKKGKGTTSRG